MAGEKRHHQQRVNASKNNEHPLDVPDDEVTGADPDIFMWCNDCEEEVKMVNTDVCPECGGTDLESIED